MGITVFSLANIWFALETADEDHSLFHPDPANATLLKAAGAAILATLRRRRSAC